jgi:hypothetical protein
MELMGRINKEFVIKQFGLDRIKGKFLILKTIQKNIQLSNYKGR